MDLVALTTDKFRKKHAAGQRDFSDANLCAVDMSAMNLSNCIFSRADLEGADLEDTDVSGVDFTDACLTGANLSNITGYYADFRKGELVETRIHYSNFDSADFRDADLRGASFVGTDLSGANFDGAEVPSTNFRGANLTDALIVALDPRQGTVFADCTGGPLAIYGLSVGDAYLLPGPNGWTLTIDRRGEPPAQGEATGPAQHEAAGAFLMDFKGGSTFRRPQNVFTDFGPDGGIDHSDPEQALLAAMCTFHIAKNTTVIETLARKWGTA